MEWRGEKWAAAVLQRSCFRKVEGGDSHRAAPLECGIAVGEIIRKDKRAKKKKENGPLSVNLCVRAERMARFVRSVTEPFAGPGN